MNSIHSQASVISFLQYAKRSAQAEATQGEEVTATQIPTATRGEKVTAKHIPTAIQGEEVKATQLPTATRGEEVKATPIKPQPPQGIKLASLSINSEVFAEAVHGVKARPLPPIVTAEKAEGVVSIGKLFGDEAQDYDPGKLGLHRIKNIINQTNNIAKRLENVLQHSDSKYVEEVAPELKEFIALLESQQKEITNTYFGKNPDPAYGAEDFPELKAASEKLESFLKDVAHKISENNQPPSTNIHDMSVIRRLKGIINKADELQISIDMKFLPSIAIQEPAPEIDPTTVEAKEVPIDYVKPVLYPAEELKPAEALPVLPTAISRVANKVEEIINNFPKTIPGLSNHLSEIAGFLEKFESVATNYYADNRSGPAVQEFKEAAKMLGGKIAEVQKLQERVASINTENPRKVSRTTQLGKQLNSLGSDLQKLYEISLSSLNFSARLSQLTNLET